MSPPIDSGAKRPLIAAICRVPLVCEALGAALENIAELHPFPADGGDTEGLLRSLHPDAVVVDSDEEAHEAEAYAREVGIPLVHVLLREQRLRVLQNGKWEEHDGDADSPEAIRNVLVGGIFGRREVA